MKRIGIWYLLVACLMLLSSCAKDESEDRAVKPANDINAAVAVGQPFPAPVDDQVDSLGTEENMIVDPDNPNVRTKCITTEKRLTKRLTDFVNLGEETDLYTGAILQGKLLNEGQLSSIGDFPREPVLLTFTGLDFGSENVSRKVQPTLSSVTQAIREVTSKGANNLGLNTYEYRISEAYSREQGQLELGIGLKTPGFGIGASVDYSTDSEKSHVFVFFSQTYFTVSMEAPSNASDVFAPTANPADLAARISTDNPAGYVKQVSYGRMLVARITSSSRNQQRRLAAEANGLFSGILSGNASQTNSQLLENSEFEIKVYGGKAENVPQNLQGIRDFINNGLVFDANTNALPVSYTVNYLNDNSRFARGDQATFKTTECRDVSLLQNFELTFKHIGIIEDCDFGVDPNNAGGFTYEIKVYLGDSLLDTFGEKDRERAKGEQIDLGNRKYTFNNLFGLPTECIRVEFSLLEDDVLGPLDPDEILAENVIISHCAPYAYSDLYTDKKSDDGDIGYRRDYVESEGKCAAYLFYQIKPLR